MVDRLKPRSPERLARARRWKHCSFFGHVEMARANMRAIMASETTSTEAKHKAQAVLYLLDELKVKLRERVEPGKEAKR